MLERAEDKRNQVKVVDIEGLVPSEHLLRKDRTSIECTGWWSTYIAKIAVAQQQIQWCW